MKNDIYIKNILASWSNDSIFELINGAQSIDVERAMTAAPEDRSIEDFAALISPAAQLFLEPMAKEAHRLTRQHFGRTMGLYVPIYLSNVCNADCTYCGYAVRSGNQEKRITLKESQIRAECEALSAQGFQNVLLLTGDAPHAAPLEFIARGVEIAREYFPSVSIEVYSMDAADYAHLATFGLEGMTCYMETYDRDVYSQVHLIGSKADYDYRLGASERAGRAGVRRLSIGVLLGLTDWRVDSFRLTLHALYLQKVCWKSALSISFPDFATRRFASTFRE